MVERWVTAILRLLNAYDLNVNDYVFYLGFGPRYRVDAQKACQECCECD